jgi:hypothetical protein
MGIGQGANAQAEPDRKATVAGGRFQRSLPTRGCNAHRPHADTVFDGIRDNLRRGVEAHWLAVEQRRTDVRMPALEPGAGVGDQRKRRSMTFRKAMRFERFEWPEGLFDEFPLVPVGHHAVDQLGLERRDAARELDVAIDLRCMSASPGVKPAQVTATRIACS